MQIRNIFTDAQLKRIVQLKKKALILEEVIKPNFEEIQRKCGQEMDADYLAYMGEWIAGEFAGEFQ